MSRHGRVWAAALGVVPVLVASACANNAPGDLTASAAKLLRPAVQDVRQAAATGSFADLRRAVQQLKNLVQQEERAGEVSAQRAVAIEDAADALLQDARPTPSPTPSSLSPTPTPTTESPTPTPTSASPTPTSSPAPTGSQTPIVSVSAVAGGWHDHGKPSPSPSSSS